jgi:septal ring factor EnvC (AmiA/AmiB activator)
VLEVQAHSRPISRLRLNFDNTKLFAAGEDGVLSVFHINDREPRKTNTVSLPAIVLSDEILIEKKKRDDLQAEIARLKADIKMHQDAHKKATEDELRANEERISELDGSIAD